MDNYYVLLCGTVDCWILNGKAHLMTRFTHGLVLSFQEHKFVPEKLLTNIFVNLFRINNTRF